MTRGRIPIITNYAATDLIHIKVNPYGGDPWSKAASVSSFFARIPVDLATAGHVYQNEPLSYEGKRIEIISPYITRANEYKGQLHFHSTGSDGVDTPTAIVTAYRDAGCDFVCLTDHNVLTADPSVAGVLFIPGVEDGSVQAGSHRHMGNVNATKSHYYENQLLNPGFETAGAGGADIWANWAETAGDGALANEVVIVHEGVDACKATAGVTANTTISQYQTVVPGEKYTIRIWTQGDGANGGRIAVYDTTNGAWILVTTEIGVTAAAWEEFEYEVTAPAGCVLMQTIFRCPAANGGVCYYDTCEIRNSDAVAEGQDMVDAILADGAFSIVNHPDYPDRSWTDAQLLETVGYTAIEIYNSLGLQNTEARWDYLLSRRVRAFGVAADDCHDLSDFRFDNASVRVFADELTNAGIMDALRRGNFYSSMGPDLSLSVSKRVLTATTSGASTIEFIGDSGTTIQTTPSATEASYTVEGDEVYVRVRITRDSDGLLAWSNPVYVYLTPTPQLSRGGVIRGALRINQESTSFAMPVLLLGQADLSEGFIDYRGTTASSAVGPISSWTTGNTIQGFVRVEINGAAYWMPYYDAPTS